LKLLERLIAFDTTSRNSNLALIEWVEAYLGARGIESHRAPNAAGDKTNLYALFGPPVAGGVVLSGHTDVVPIDGQSWSSDPFKLTQKGDRFYGRGTADMKSFLALALAHVDTALAARLRRPIILAFSYDEEVGCLGAPSMIADLVRMVPPPQAVIVGEPTNMKIVSGHKGISTFVVEVEGLEAHSSQTQQGVSAIMAALPLMELVATMAREAGAHNPADCLFTPAHPTMTIGIVEGGTAVNILARRCQFIWDLRCPPDVDGEPYIARFMEAAAQIDADIKSRAPEGGVRVTRRSSTPPFAIDRDSAAEKLVRRLTGDNGMAAAAYAAEAGLFQRAGFSVVLCGPGDIAQAHQADEWIAQEQLELGAAFMRNLIADLARPGGV
jgi:acetylornithine deacetylase